MFDVHRPASPPTPRVSACCSPASRSGIRHGIDWDHIAAITDITSTTAAAGVAEAAHAEQHASVTGHHHGHGGDARDARPRRRSRRGDARPGDSRRQRRRSPASGRSRARRSGSAPSTPSATASVVIALGLAAIAFGALLPDWLDPIMGRIVGLTLVVLGAVGPLLRLPLRRRRRVVPAAQPLDARCSTALRYGWRRLQARLHGHEHVEPLEMSSYGNRTAFGVGMIHGVGAETGTQVLLIAAVGGAASAGLGVPMLFAFVLGLLISNFAIVLLSSVGFVASQTRERIYVAIGAVAGVFSLVARAGLPCSGMDAIVPEMDSPAARSESAPRAPTWRSASDGANGRHRPRSRTERSTTDR